MATRFQDCGASSSVFASRYGCPGPSGQAKNRSGKWTPTDTGPNSLGLELQSTAELRKSRPPLPPAGGTAQFDGSVNLRQKEVEVGRRWLAISQKSSAVKPKHGDD
jgi:hypothetical protein